MCGRYQLTLPLEALRDIFEFQNEAEPFPARYNIAPTQPIHVVREAAVAATGDIVRFAAARPLHTDRSCGAMHDARVLRKEVQLALHACMQRSSVA